MDKRFFYAVVVALLLSACVSSGITPIGSNTFSPLPPGSPVYVYRSEKEVPSPFKAIGIISYSNPGKYRNLSLNDVIPALKDLAREAGANGIIIDETHVIK
jgi:hypothetical protein